MRLIEYSMPLVFAACAGAGALPVVSTLGWKGAIAFGVLLTAFLLLGRAFAQGTMMDAVRGAVSVTKSRILSSVIIDAVTLLAVIALDPRLVWGAVAVVIFSEIFYMA